MSWKLVNQFVTRPELDLLSHEAHVYHFMLDRAKDDGTAIFPSLEAIMIGTRRKRRQIQYIVKSLEAKGYLIRINPGNGRGKAAMWHTPLDQWGNIEPRPPVVESTEERPATSEKRARRAKHLTEVARPGADEPFLDVDQIGKEIVTYHQALTQYEQGYVGNKIRLLPQPGQPGGRVSVTEIVPIGEVERVQIDAFYADLELEVAKVRIIAEQCSEKIARYETAIPTLKKEMSRALMEDMLQKAYVELAEYQVALVELEELLQKQQPMIKKGIQHG